MSDPDPFSTKRIRGSGLFFHETDPKDPYENETDPKHITEDLIYACKVMSHD